MAWMKFGRDFDWSPKLAVTIAYKAGMVENVTRGCAEAAEAIGAGKRTTSPRRRSEAESDAAE